MSNTEVHRLPDWFERPVTQHESVQRTLFVTSLYKVLASLRVSIDEVTRWHQRGWVTCDVSVDYEVDEWDDPHVYEIEFIRDVVRSGLSDAQIEWLLSQLPRPFSFNPDCIAYSFRHGWIIASRNRAPDPDEIIEEHIDDWLKNCSEGRLQNLAERIASQIQSIANDDSATEEEEPLS